VCLPASEALDRSLEGLRSVTEKKLVVVVVEAFWRDPRKRGSKVTVGGLSAFQGTHHFLHGRRIRLADKPHGTLLPGRPLRCPLPAFRGTVG
jgi:hypothetical protein